MSLHLVTKPGPGCYKPPEDLMAEAELPSASADAWAAPMRPDGFAMLLARKVQKEGECLQDSSAAAYLARTAGPCFSGEVSPEGMQAYRDRVLKEAGITDPFAVMLAE